VTAANFGDGGTKIVSLKLPHPLGSHNLTSVRRVAYVVLTQDNETRLHLQQVSRNTAGGSVTLPIHCFFPMGMCGKEKEVQKRLLASQAGLCSMELVKGMKWAVRGNSSSSIASASDDEN